MLYRKWLFKEIVFLSVVIAVAHYYASLNSLYWSIDWFDIPMHFFGGLLMGLIALFAFFTSGKIHLPQTNRVVIFSITVSFVLIIGLFWELWELFAGLSSVLNDLGDTILDLVMDTVGAIVAYLFAVNRIWIRN